MIKKFFSGLMAAALLIITSCQKQEFAPGQDATVTFEVATPEIATRAYSDGTTATHLQYAVYDANGNYLEMLTNTNAEIKGSANVQLQLTTGNQYSIVFWAAAPDAPYTLDFANKTVTVDYTSAKSNDENRDAFYSYHTFTVSAKTEKVQLQRPFAQLNIGTADYTASGNAGYVPTQSSVTVKNIYSTLNFDGSVANPVEVEFGYANINRNETFPVSGNEYLAMNYLLVAKDKETVEVEFNFTNGSNEKTRTVGGVPVQRNYRTNIYGNLLTSEVDINVEIAPEYNEPSIGYILETDATTGQVTAIVETASGMATIAEEIAKGNIESNVDIVLDGDIDLSELTALTRSAIVNNWNPIGTEDEPFTGTFDGKSYTIKNLALVEEEAKEGKAFIGFFGYAKNATIKNVTFENVYINIPCLDIDHSQGHIGAVAGSLEGTSTIENVTVKGDIQVYATQDANGASRVAVVAGGNSYGDVTMKNVHVIANEGSYLIANNNTGALAGQLQGKMVFENCSSNIDVTVNKFFAGGLVGIAAGDSYFKNCHTTGDVAVVAGREGRHNDEYRVGGIAGGWADGATKVCTLEDCTYTGNVSGKNADGAVADPLDYWGYVGRGYTLANCEGSKVIIDGTEFVQVGNSAPYGNYTINGLTPVATADELVAALEASEGVFLMNDIKIDPAAMSNAYGKTGINVKNGQTIDGNGHTLNIQGAGGTWDSGINTTGGLIKNITVTGSFRGIFINHTSTHSEKVVLENVTITGTVYTISCDQGLYQGIQATNCTFNGWTSFAKTAGEAKFVNCEFGEGNGYKYCRPYSKTEFVECTFCPGYTVDQSQAEVTFTDCTWEE